MGVRRKSREFALQMLFQADLGRQNADQVRESFWHERPEAEAEVRDFTEEIFTLAMGQMAEIDALIAAHAQHWRMERMSAVDRNILRAAVAELMGFPQTPPAVVINESLEVARKFSSSESIHFINGVLDSTARELRQQQQSAAP